MTALLLPGMGNDRLPVSAAEAMIAHNLTYIRPVVDFCRRMYRIVLCFKV